jgi:hypothetical protein
MFHIILKRKSKHSSAQRLLLLLLLLFYYLFIIFIIFIFINTLFSPISSYSSNFIACANFVIGLWAVKFCT